MAGVNLIGNSIGTYQPPGFFGVPGMSGGAPAAQPSGADFAGALSMLGIGGAGTGGPGVMSGGNTAATIQSMQNAPNSTLGNIQRGIGAVSMANGIAGKLGGGSATLGQGLGALGGGLSFINGIQQGGVLGYGSALAGGLRAASGIEGLLGNADLAGSLGSAAGYVAAPLALYSAVKNFKSGATGNDIMQGVSAGSAIGSVIPGVGTLIGAGVGALVGGIASAFGGGTDSQEATMAHKIDSGLQGANDQQRMQAISGFSPAQNIQTINGYMNAHNSDSSEAIQQAFGKNGVANMFGQMMPAINNAISKNPAYAKMNAQQLYTNVVAPWLKGKGASINTSSKDVKGNTEGSNLQDSIIATIGQWQSGAFNSKTPVGVKGQTINIPTYGG